VISNGKQIDYQHGRVVYCEEERVYNYEDNSSEFGSYFRIQGEIINLNPHLLNFFRIQRDTSRL